MNEDTKFCLTIVATIIIGPAIQVFLQILLGRYFLRYTDREVANLKKELEEKRNKSKQTEAQKIEKMVLENIKKKTREIYGANCNCEDCKPQIFK